MTSDRDTRPLAVRVRALHAYEVRPEPVQGFQPGACLCQLQKVAKGVTMKLFSGGDAMSVALKLSDELVEMAKPHAAAEHRSVPKQIEYWARLGKAVDDNPGMPLQFIKDTLLAVQEAKAGQLAPYTFGA